MRIVAMMLAASLGVGAGAQPAKRAAKPAAAAPKPIPATGTLGNLDLVAIAKLAVAAQKDEFSEDRSKQYVGREFTIDIPNDELYSKYDRDKGALTSTLSAYSDYVILEREVTETKVAGQNGYGAKATVSKVRGQVYALWLPGSFYSRKPIAYEGNLSGESARQLSKAIRLRLSGRIITADGPYAEKGSILFKSSVVLDATVDRPVDHFTTTYGVASQLTKAEWIDGNSGAILRTDNFAS